MSGRRRVDCAGTAERSYTVERKPTPRSRSGSCLRPTTSILQPMEGGVARTKCLRADTAIRTRVHGASNNFGNGYRSYCLTRQSTLADQSASKRAALEDKCQGRGFLFRSCSPAEHRPPSSLLIRQKDFE